MSFIICGEKRKCGRQEGKNNSVSTLSSTDAQWAPSHLLEYHWPVSSTMQEIKPRAVLALPQGEPEITSCCSQVLAGAVDGLLMVVQTGVTV